MLPIAQASTYRPCFKLSNFLNALLSKILLAAGIGAAPMSRGQRGTRNGRYPTPGLGTSSQAGPKGIFEARRSTSQ